MSNEMMFASLMDLASVDTSEMSAQLSRLPKAGIYILELEELKFAEQAPKDPADPMNYTLGIKGSTLFFQPLDPNESGEGMEGKSLSERYFLYGKEVMEAIQLLMGRFKVAGFRHKGTMGGVEGNEPGWIEEALGKRVAVRVRIFTSKDGQERAGYDWLSPKALEKAGIEWASLGRDFLDENGQPVQQAA